MCDTDTAVALLSWLEDRFCGGIQDEDSRLLPAGVGCKLLVSLSVGAVGRRRHISAMFMLDELLIWWHQAVCVTNGFADMSQYCQK